MDRPKESGQVALITAFRDRESIDPGALRPNRRTAHIVEHRLAGHEVNQAGTSPRVYLSLSVPQAAPLLPIGVRRLRTEPGAGLDVNDGLALFVSVSAAASRPLEH